MVSNGQLIRQSIGTSSNVSSVLLEQAAKFIAADVGANPTTENLENAIRNGKNSILVMGQRTELAPYIQKASVLLDDIAITSMQESLRVEKTSPDIVVVPGGGANFFLKAISEAFPRLKTVVPNRLKKYLPASVSQKS